MENKAKRVFLILLDSFGIGAAPDAHEFGDAGASTLGSLIATGALNIKNMTDYGFGEIDGVSTGKRRYPSTVGRLREISRGKDTTVGHWELMGLHSSHPLPTYPNGFPDRMIKAIEQATGRGVLCNLPYSGTKVIADYGKEHTESGKLIVYTSADSVLQIAAHEDIVPVEELYSYCRMAREIAVGEDGVGRIIARPFAGSEGNYYRTENRRDFSLKPHGRTALDILKSEGYDVIGVGKISDIFAGEGLTESYPTHGNAEGIEKAIELTGRDFNGLAFINLVDFDMLYGHRQDAAGYTEAINAFDKALPRMIEGLRAGDRLIITADHGCDPSDDSTDHTREYVPYLLIGGEECENLGTVSGFDYVGRTVLKLLGAKETI